MTTSQTGNLNQTNQQQAGFSLIEVILCVIILSVGLIAINRALLGSLGTLHYIETRFEADRVMQNQIWEIQSQARHQKIAPAPRERGEWLGLNKVFSYEMLSAPLDAENQIYEVRVRAEWPESGKNQGMSRAFYAVMPPIQKK